MLTKLGDLWGCRLEEFVLPAIQRDHDKRVSVQRFTRRFWSRIILTFAYFMLDVGNDSYGCVLYCLISIDTVALP